jgi:hypothetical protein
MGPSSRNVWKFGVLFTRGNLSVWFNKEIKPPEDVLKANLAQDLVELALIHLII